MMFFQFNLQSSFEEYVKSIEDVIAQTVEQKRKFGFWLHDQNNDDKLCPLDIKTNKELIGPKYSYLLWFDFDQLDTILADQIKSIHESEPVKEIEAEFEKLWNEKNTGVKERREPIVFSDDEQEVVKDQNKEEGKAHHNRKLSFRSMKRYSITSDVHKKA